VKPEIWISIYAAILATTALALNIKTWFDSGVKLKLFVIPDGVVMGGDPQFDEKDLVILNVINRGRTPTMVSNSCFLSTKINGESGATGRQKHT
jgi:hypothetical protein